MLLMNDDDDEIIGKKVGLIINLWLCAPSRKDQSSVFVIGGAAGHIDQSGSLSTMAALAAYRHLLRATRIAFQGKPLVTSILAV